MTFGALTWSWLLPALGGAAALGAGRRARPVALAAAALTLALLFALPALSGNALESLAELGPRWGFGIRYALGVDGLSLSLCWLTTLLTVIALLASWRRQLSVGFEAAFLFLEAALLGAFIARDLLLFFLFWESALVTMFLIIALWGGEGRERAARKFFLFMSAGSALLLLGLLGLAAASGKMAGAWSWSMGLRGPDAGPAAAIFAALLAGFAAQAPIAPLHGWLPEASAEAPTAGAIMLCGALPALGVYGIMRVLIPAFPELSWEWLPWLGGLAALNVIYGALRAMAQSQLKRLLAYASVAQIGFCLLGVFSRTPEGLAGGGLHLLHHGLSLSALFLLVGALDERAGKQGLGDFGGLAERAPRLGFFFGVALFASIGLPGLGGFVGQFMALAGATRVLPVLAIAGALGVVLAAAYALPAYQAVFWAEPGPDSASASVSDLDWREQALLWFLSTAMLWIGLYPRPLLQLLEGGVRGLWL